MQDKKEENPFVVAVVGSERTGSSTEIALNSVGEGVREGGGKFELLRLGEYNLPPLNVEENTPDDAKRIRDIIGSADGLILGTPVYHGSYSSSLKCAIDYCSFDEFENTTVGLVAVAGGSFPTPALTHMRIICRSLNAWVLPKQLAVPDAKDNFNTESGKLTNPDYKSRAVEMGHQLSQYSVEPKNVSTGLSDENIGG